MNWELILATVNTEPVPMPAVNATGRDLVRQLRASLWMAGHVTLSLAEVMALTDV